MQAGMMGEEQLILRKQQRMHRLIILGAALILSVLLLIWGRGDLAAQTEAQVDLLPADQIGAQASADIGFADLAPPEMQNKVRHVDPNGADNVAGTADDGSDTNPGTRELPWRTIGKATKALRVDKFQVGYVHGGTYSERVTTANSGTATAPLRLLEAPGESAVIKGSGSSGNPFIRITKSYWVIDGFEIDAGDSRNHAIRFQTDLAQGFSAHHAVVRNVEAHHGRGAAAVVFQGASDAALLNSKIHDYRFGDKDSHGVAIWRGSKRILVKGNESWGNDGDDIQCNDGDHVVSADDPADITIEGNRYGNTHPWGATRPRTRENATDIKSCRDVTVRGNTMFGFRPTPVRCTSTCAPYKEGAIVIHSNASRILVERNRIWDSGMAARIVTQPGTPSSVVFRRNLVFDIATGTGLSTNSDGSGAGIVISNVPDAEIYHNTFYNLRGKAIGVGDEGTVNRADVINNIVQTAGTGFSRGGVSSLTMQKNLFWETSHGAPPGSIVADPMFVDDPRTNDFYTEPGSPARDSALHEPRFVDATNFNYCHAGPDIGFLESCTSEPGSE